jgi:hypothetical protein
MPTTSPGIYLAPPSSIVSFFFDLTHSILLYHALSINPLNPETQTIKMKFTTAITALTLFAAASAFPNRGDAQKDIKFPVPDGMTVKEGSSKCGDQAQLSCCNKAKYGADTTVVADGLAAGLLSNLLGAGSAAEGLGAFTECSKLDLSRMFMLSMFYRLLSMMSMCGLGMVC